MRRSANIIFIATMGIICLAPLIQMTTDFIRVPPLDERRELHGLSNVFPRLRTLDTSLSRDTNAWFDDHYGFRDLLIRAKNEVYYQAFGVADKVLVGHNGYLFDAGAYNGILALGLNRDRYFNVIMHSVDQFEMCLARRGVHLVVVYNPNKSTVYPEDLPSYVAKPPRDGLAQDVARAIKMRPNVIFVDSEEILAKHKDETVFYKTDFHMDPKGALYVYTDMVAQVAAASRQAVPVTRDIKFAKTYWDYGGEERFLSKFLAIGEMLDAPTNFAIVLKDDPNGHWVKDIGDGAVPGYPDLPAFDWKFENLRQDTTLLPAIVVFGTSYTDEFFDLGFHEGFMAVYRTKSNVASRIGPVMKNLPPETKFLVVEYPESFILLLSELSKACS